MKMHQTIVAFAVLSLVEYVASAAYDATKNTWDNAEVAKELTTTDKKAPNADKDYKGVMFSFVADKSKVKAKTPPSSEFVYKLEITDITFKLHGNLPDEVKQHLSGGNSGSSLTPGKGTALPDCKLLGRNKATFQDPDIAMGGTLKLVIRRPTSDNANDKPNAECICSGATVDSAISTIWRTQCKLSEGKITTNACDAMKPVCEALLKANGQKQ